MTVSRMPLHAAQKGLQDKCKGGLVMERGETTTVKVQELGRGKAGVFTANSSLQGALLDRGRRGERPSAQVELETLITLCNLVGNGS